MDFEILQQMKALPFFIMGGCLAFGSLFACTVSPDRGNWNSVFLKTNSTARSRLEESEK